MKVKSQNFTKAQVTKKKISHTILTRDRHGAKEITKALILQLNEIFQKTEKSNIKIPNLQQKHNKTNNAT